MLLMKKRYFEAIRSGDKTTTLRYWTFRRVRPGSMHTVPGLGKVRIREVAEVSPEAIDDDLARGDGFASAEALRAALAEHYTPAQRVERTLYLVRFELAADGEGRAGEGRVPS